MSRKYMNEKWCVRCNRKDPTPFLRDNWRLLMPCYADAEHNGFQTVLLDIGCGNGRNSNFIDEKLDLYDAIGLDMVGDYDWKFILGESRFPVKGKHVNIILANYVFMFLDESERKQVIKEIKRVAAPGCSIMVEMYPAKDSHAKTEKEAAAMMDEIYALLGWQAIKYNKLRFIAKAP